MEDIPFQTERADGKVIRGVIFRPDNTDKDRPTVVFSHGFGSNYRELMHHGSGIADAGIVCVFFDFCGGGPESSSDGEMTEMTVLTEAEDLKAVMQKISTLPYIRNDSLYLMGESQGGFVSAIVAAEKPELVKGLILWYPAFVIPDDAARRNRQKENAVFGISLGAEYDRIAMGINVEKIQKAYQKPVIIIHGDNDGVVPVEYSRRAERTYPHATLKIIPGAGHGFDGRDSVEARKVSVDFINLIEMRSE